MIDEVQVIKPGGVPLYYSSSSGDLDEITNNLILQTSLLSAISDFAVELENGELQRIILENKSYLIRKGDNFTIVFTNSSNEKIWETEKRMDTSFEFLEKTFSEYNLTGNEIGLHDYDQAIEIFEKHLKEEKILGNTGNIETAKFREKVDNALFRAVGYTPGVCNIGLKERYFRLSWGIGTIAISLVLFLLMLVLDVDRNFRLLLYLTNSVGFSGILQYFHKFCVANGMSKQYSIDYDGNQNRISVPTKGRIMNPEDIKRDKQKAYGIMGQITILSSALTFLMYIF